MVQDGPNYAELRTAKPLISLPGRILSSFRKPLLYPSELQGPDRRSPIVSRWLTVSGTARDSLFTVPKLSAPVGTGRILWPATRIVPIIFPTHAWLASNCDRARQRFFLRIRMREFQPRNIPSARGLSPSASPCYSRQIHPRLAFSHCGHSFGPRAPGSTKEMPT